MRRLFNTVVGAASIAALVGGGFSVNAGAQTLAGAKCTPKPHAGHLIKAVVKGQPAPFRWVTTYPKGSGKIARGGFCHVMRPGLGKRRKVYIKLASKHTVPKTVVQPPATVVGNPPPVVVTPVTTPVVTPPVTPPVITNPVVTPPANPDPVVTPPVMPTLTPPTCRDLGIVPPGSQSGDVGVSLHFTMPAGASFVRATFFWGDTSSDNSDAATFEPLTGLWESDDTHIYMSSDTFNVQGVVTVAYSNGVGVPPTLVSSPIQKIGTRRHPSPCTQAVTITLPSAPPLAV